MLLISKGMYDVLYAPRKYLIIDPIDDASFASTCYYFRLGAIREGEKLISLNEPVSLGKRERKCMFTVETFTLKERVLALIGPCTELMGKGLCLHNSPTIDPGFSGSLEMFLENMTDSSISLDPGMTIGKAVFFDVSDTIIDLAEYVFSEKQKTAYITRKQIGNKIRESLTWIERDIIDKGNPVNQSVNDLFKSR